MTVAFAFSLALLAYPLRRFFGLELSLAYFTALIFYYFFGTILHDIKFNPIASYRLSPWAGRLVLVSVIYAITLYVLSPSFAGTQGLVVYLVPLFAAFFEFRKKGLILYVIAILTTMMLT